MDGTLALAAAAVLLVGWGVFIFALASRGGNTLYDGDAYGVCAPRRYDSLTGQPAYAPRHIIEELAPPAGWREVTHVALNPAPAAAQYDEDEDADGDAPIGVPESVLIALLTGQPVEQPAVVEPEPLTMVVNATVARFAFLEVRR